MKKQFVDFIILSVCWLWVGAFWIFLGLLVWGVCRHKPDINKNNKNDTYARAPLADK